MDRHSPWRDAKSTFPSFAEIIRVLTGPLKKTTSVEAWRVKAFVVGVSRKRKRRVYVPGGSG